jgi:hypothetical protein
VASLADTDDLAVILEAWLDKQADDASLAGEQAQDFGALQRQELEAWQRWRQNPNPQDFKWLHESHQPLIFRAQERNLRSTTLPKAAVRSDGLRKYITALQTWNPSKGAFSTHLNYVMQHNNRYLTKYQNVGKIPAERAEMIGLMQNRLAHLRETLGREPSNAELADDMKTSMGEVAELSRKMQKLTPRTVETLRRELRRDLNAEAPGGEVHLESSPVLDHLIFLHGSLSPEQQVVLEHTFEGFGKPVIEDPMKLGPVIGMSPQKIRALRQQIHDKVQKYVT